MRGWSRRRIKWLASEVRDTVDPKALNADAVFHYSIPSFDYVGDGTVEPTEDIGSDKLLLRGGEVLISKLNPRISRVLIASKHSVPTLASTEFIALNPGPDLDSRFLCYWLESDIAKQFLDGATMSVTRSHERVRPDILTGGWLDVPETHTQCAIADYLDRETARIDALVSDRQRTLRLGEERRRAAKLRAVTQGLARSDDHVSPQPWLTDVPAHWTATKLCYIADIRSGGTPNTKRDDYWDGDISWVSPKDVKRFDLVSSEDHVTREAVVDTGLSLVEPGAVLFVARGMILARAFPVSINSMQTTINQDMKAVIPRDVDARFLAHLLHGLGDVVVGLLVEESAHGTRVLRMDRWKKFPLYLPPLKEQIEIARHLDTEADAVDSIATMTGSQIALFQERRQALVTAAVTGQLEIPDAA